VPPDGDASEAMFFEAGRDRAAELVRLVAASGT